MKDKLARWVANRLPRRVVYFCAIRVWAHATSGTRSGAEVPSVTVVDALASWEPL